MIKHSGCKFLIVVASLMWGLTASHAYAQNCELLFESPLQVHDLNGAVRFRLSSRVYDAPNDELITPLIIEEPLTLSCGWSDCSASGTTAPPIYINDFKLSAATTDIDVGILQSATTDGVQTQFRNVVVNSTGNLTFNSAQSEYLIDTLHLKLSATVKLPAGDYWVNNLIMDYGANIKVLGEGTVRLMVNNDTALADEVDINQTASAHQLFMYVNGSLNLGPNARLDGFVYSQGPMDVGSFSVLKGAFNASIVELHSGTAVYSRHDNAALVNYGDSCQQSFSYPDLDGDGIPDINDLDIDNDGIGNDYERMVGTDPYLASDVPVDADGDDVPDSLEGYAGTYCSAAFETGLQTHTQNGLVDFGSYSLMENAPTSQLRSSQVVNSNALFSADSCGNTDCSASGVPSPFILAPDFKFSTSSTDISGSATLGNDGQREFDEVTPLLFSTITFAQPGEYRIRKLNLWSSSTVVLAPGDYWIEQLSMASYTKIKVQGEGTVRLFVYSSSVTGNSSELNMPGGNEGDPAKLVIYAWQAFELGAYSDTSAYLYARGDINTEGSTKFYGAMAGANIDLSYSDKMYFRNQNLYQADFGLLCDVDNDGVFDGLDDDLDGDGLTNDLEAANNADPMNPDSDGDGLLDGEEVLTYQSNPQLVDSDSDGLSDSLEVWEFGTSPIKADTDDDGLSDTDELQTYETDPLVPDTDEDQLSDGYEVLTSGTDPLLPDTDEDGLLDGPEILTHGTDPLDADSDDDSLSDGAEINEHQTNPLAADSDADGLTDPQEINTTQTDPLNPDTDGDGLTDGAEINTHGSNPLMDDTDGDGITDGAEVNTYGTNVLLADTDSDGLSDGAEINTHSTNPLLADTDGDGLSDGEEVNTHGTNPLSDDSDGDGLTDSAELTTHGTNPLLADTDGDGLADGAEVNTHGTNPLQSDTDSDGLSDGAEINTHGTNPLLADTDGDGLADGAEVNTHGTNPLLADSDSDGVSDGDEVNTHGTNPLQADSDGDGLSDGAELNEHSTDPLQADTDGDGLSDGDEVNSTNTDPNLADTDSDGLSDGDEVNVHNTDPLDADSDDDTLNDGDEINTHGTNPNLADSDSDGLTDAQEVLTYNTNPNVQDSDSDGLTDGAEVNTHGTDPLKPDSDEDGLSDGAEINTHGTNPLLADSDGDTLSDGDEINTYGSNPLLTDSDSDGIADNVEVVNGTNPAKADTDDDGVDDAADQFPTDPAEWSDLDGDGQGDNSDPDRDNDGYSNEEEVAAGSDPNDPNSIPDTTPPEITVLGSQPFETDEDYFTLNGIATDLSGVASLTITNDQSAGTITAQFSGDNWGADVPVELGVNNLQLKAVDTKGNEATVIVAVERLSTDTVVRLTIDSPVGYSKVTEPYVVVTGKLQSEVRSENIVLTVDNEPTALQSTALNTEYTYRSAPVQLQEGNNTILVQAVLDTQTLQRSVVVIYEPEVAETDAPLISLLSPAPGSMLNSDSFTLAGEAISFSGAAQIRVNGELVSLQGGQTQAGSFQEILNFPAGAESFQVTASITDGENRTVAAQAIYYRDITPPVISVGGGLQPVPTENRVVASRYELFGVISETNLAGFTVNGQPVSVEPGAAAGEYLFSLPLALSVSTPLTVELNARDAAGNSTSLEYTLLRDGSVTVDPLLPADGSEFINQGQPIALQVAAAIAGLSADLTTYAVLTNAADEILDQQTLSGSSTLLAGTVTIPAQAGDYDIAIEVRDLTDKVVGTAGLSVSVRDPQQVPVAIQKIEPANNATDIEPNGFVSVYFNQPVDPALVSITVNETLNGFTYIDSDPRGVSGMRGAGHRLVEVNRSFEAVAGSIAPLPGSTVMAFYPERELGYGANVFITVTYDGNEMERAQFKVRDLPTFITGGVQDQLGQPLAGITVKLKELNRSTKTDRDGAYHFGFGDAAKNNIPSGEYTLEFNPEFKDTRYGSISFRESVVEGRMNPMDLRTVPALDPTINFVPVQGGGEVTLLGGDLVMDLTDTRLVFPDQNTSGPIHVQFTDFSQFPYPLGPLGYGHWLYFVQPGGIAVEGSITGLDIAMPAIMGSYDYVPDNGYYVVMLGLDDRSQLIVPVGVGQIENYRVRSVGELQYQRLDAIGYGMVPYEWQETLAKYANGDISLELMRAELSSVVNSTSGQ